MVNPMREKNTHVPLADSSPDGEDRVRDFLTRHGGASSRPPRDEAFDSNARGWSEVYAADGYTLRCDWSRLGTREEFRFSELPPNGAP